VDCPTRRCYFRFTCVRILALLVESGLFLLFAEIRLQVLPH